MKKFTLFLIILTFAFSLSACGSNNKNVKTEAELELEISGVPETGRVFDISDKNEQSATTTPGDVLYLKLTGEANSGNQWSVVSPTSGNFLMLKEHIIIGLNDPEILDGKFSDEWWLKIEETGTFDLQFNYGVAGEEPEQFFEFKVISQ